ncbi:MAG: TRAP transporter large permease [Candidatus Competibacteraceae bacterium]|nr:TRAP transporter large permease [Candidatus Competibacteraceae bacterium]
MTSLLLLALPLALFFIGLPVFAVLLTIAAAALLWFASVPPLALHQVMFGGIDNYALLAVPFFIFAGELMGRGGIAERLVRWVNSFTGPLPGSLALTAIGSSTLMGAISGSSPATVAALGKTLYPGLRRAGYSAPFAAGLLSSSGSVAIVLPPSIAMILYGAAAEQSIPKLFIAGMLPGLLIGLAMALYVMLRVRRSKPGQAIGQPFCWAAFAAATRQAWAALLMPVFILAGIYLGWFSPTEAGGFACAYAILCSRFVLRSLSWRETLAAAAEAAWLTAQVLVIVAGAAAFSWILTILGVPQALLQWLGELNLSSNQFLLAVNAVLLLLGCIVDPTSAILVLAPILVPMASSLGIDPIHFGVIMVVNLSLGMFTPPFGLNLFVAQSVLGVDLHTIWRGIVPFFLVQLVALLLITYIPALSLLLANPL